MVIVTQGIAAMRCAIFVAHTCRTTFLSRLEQAYDGRPLDRYSTHITKSPLVWRARSPPPPRPAIGAEIDPSSPNMSMPQMSGVGRWGSGAFRSPRAAHAFRG